MTRLLVLAAGLATSLTAANACDYMRSAKAQTVDPTVVASVAIAQPMSTAQTAIPAPEQTDQNVGGEIAE
jgi:hypothetical protein